MRAERRSSRRASSATATLSAGGVRPRRGARCCTPRPTRIYRSDAARGGAREGWRDRAHRVRRAHLREPFRRLAAHPRLVRPVEQLLGGKCYIHQFKINAKAAFDGDVWQWHQDYGTWSRDDLMPEPRAMNIALFLDDVTEFNGPLMFIPGSHQGAACSRRATMPRPRAIRSGRSTTRRCARSPSAAGWSRPRGRRARC